MIDNATQGGLWDRAQLYGARSREKLATFNDARLTGLTHYGRKHAGIAQRDAVEALALGLRAIFSGCFQDAAAHMARCERRAHEGIRAFESAPYVRRRSIGVVFSHPDGSTPVEKMGAWLASLGFGYDPELGATRLDRPEPKQAPVPRTMTAGSKPAAAAPAKPSTIADSAIAEAFSRFGKAPAFRRAFTARGQLRKGWTLVNGAPTWVEAF
jgi:hypothetical protein